VERGEEMRVLSEESDKEFRENIDNQYGIKGDTEIHWEPVDIGEHLSTTWEEQEKNNERLKEFKEVLKESNSQLFVVAFTGGQYIPKFQEKFEQKYKSRTVEIEPEELTEVREDLITFYLFPEDLSWAFLSDHEGRLIFSGEITEKAKEIIDEEKLKKFEY
jgi:hypothetical protein